MKKISFVVLMTLLVNPGIDAQESFLTPSDGLTTSIPFEGIYSALEISNNTLYALEADTVYFIDLISGSTLKKLGLPDQSYKGFPSFITISPNATDVWVGYTTGDNSDDRIYYINTTDNIWNHVATFPANFDLAFWKGQAIVTGLNSSSWSDPTGIWLLDDSGQDKHRLLIALDGYSAGLDIDNAGNVYYASSYFSDNALLKWNTDDITAVMESTNDTLKAESATVLTNLPAGSYDIDLDRTGNIVFSCNKYVEDHFESFIGMWDENDSYDTLATTDLFLTHLSTWGNISLKDPGNEVYAMAYGTEIAEVHFDIPQALISVRISEAITVYPNPAVDYIKIKGKNLSKGLVTITDLNGRTVLKQEHLNSDEAINVTSLVPGNYVLTYRTNKHIYKALILKK